MTLAEELRVWAPDFPPESSAREAMLALADRVAALEKDRDQAIEQAAYFKQRVMRLEEALRGLEYAYDLPGFDAASIRAAWETARAALQDDKP